MNPDLCGGGGTSNGLSSAWTMVTAHPVDSSGSDGHAQVGYLDMGASYPYVTDLGAPSGYHRFSEWTRKCFAHGTCGSTIAANISFSTYATPDAGTDTFDVHRVASDGHLHMYINGTNVDEVGYNTTGDWNSAWAVEILGETKHWQDNLVGTPTDPINFDNLQRYESDGSINFFTGLSKAEAPPRDRYHFGWTSPSGGGQGFKIWTDPL